MKIPFYRLAQETVDDRLQKELTERESWYKPKKDDQEDDDEQKIFSNHSSSSRASTTSRRWRSSRRSKKPTTSGNGDQPKIRSVIFIPHTPNSELAKELRNKENEMYKITGDKMKIVEKSGNKLEDILTKKDPWRGADCGRANCFLCNTKLITEKDKNKDCTKRNIVYEIRCLTCETNEKERIAEICGDDEKKKEEMESNMKVPKYVGETGRSAYERGYEHLDQLASLNKKSHMLRHMLDQHSESDFSEVRWGMFILRYKRTAFDRQIDEAVAIDRECI